MKEAIIIPARNEQENIEKLVKGILRLNLGLSIVIIDDNSKDQTGEIADRLSQKYPEVKVIHRKEKNGLGAAYVEGLKYVLSLGAEKVVTMDADFSHNPKDIPRLLKESEKYDVVVGSRYISGGGVVRWELWRRLLSWGGINISRILLGLKIKDCTAGFKCYNRKFLESLNLNEISCQGYAFQTEMILRAQEQGFSISEIPIIFKGREKGESKVNFKEILRFATNVLRLALRRHCTLFKKNSQKMEKIPPNYYDESIKNNLFQRYYHQHRFKEIIDLIGEFDGKILDIGCDGGTFINEISQAFPKAKFYAIDKSEEAISYAQKKYPQISFQVGDAHNLKFPDQSFNLITMLEVLEHVEDPAKVVTEAKRCLEPGGSLIVLVPTENLFFKIIWYFWTKGKGRVWEGKHLQKFEGNSLDNLLKQRGFEIEKRKIFNFGLLLAIKARKPI
jgi:dolichol-phosphate mannosyltransferase